MSVPWLSIMIAAPALASLPNAAERFARPRRPFARRSGASTTAVRADVGARSPLPLGRSAFLS